MKVEVLRRSCRSGEVCEGRRGRDHEEGEGLGSRRGQRLLMAVRDVVCLDAVDGVEQLGVLMTCQLAGGLRSLIRLEPTCA